MWPGRNRRRNQAAKSENKNQVEAREGEGRETKPTSAEGTAWHSSEEVSSRQGCSWPQLGSDPHPAGRFGDVPADPTRDPASSLRGRWADSMELWLAGGLLPLLLLAWLPAGLTYQVSAMINVSVGLDFALQCLLQTNSTTTTTGEVKCFNSTPNNGEKQSKGAVAMKSSSFQLVFTSVNKAHTGTYTCRIENTRNVSVNGDSKENKDARQAEESDTTMECTFKIWLENLTVKWYKPADLEVGNRTHTTALGKNCTSPSVCAVNMRICECRVSITRLNLTDTGNGMQGTLSSCGTEAPQNSVTEKGTSLKGEKDEQQGGKQILMFSGLNFLLCVLFGLAVGTLLYMPIIGILLWQCQKNRKEKLVAMQVVEEDQLSTAAPVTGTEELTYANLKFEKERKPTSSDVIYTKIKPLQQKQGGGDGGDAGAANTEVDVFPEGEGK
ncbi:PREDICTED: uncharacterized protein LOC106891158 [Calidris pugnax]|uniref:uncharacterized protein LOC106891158 n=1 Tax=Calidris pugnax TaxID=198806 RepID=UPI00071D20DC|nr:PREDICTED: uncharacterized protein LOC106891158 [Calidris pugnax]